MLDVGLSTLRWAKKNHVDCIFEEKISGTNEMAKVMGLKENLDLWIYLTNQQTHGRGRRENTWENVNKPGHQLLSTWCYRLQTPPQHVASPLFGWAVYKALSYIFDLALSIKAPNDIYIDSKKVGGILLESLSQGSDHMICVGLGLNVSSYPQDIEIATSLNHGIKNDLEESRWHNFLSHLKLNFNEAIEACTQQKISPTIRHEILDGLKKWPTNNITHILSDGTLILEDSRRIHWSDL